MVGSSLYASYNGKVLYVAMTSAQRGHDHLLYLHDGTDAGPTVPPPFGKSGRRAARWTLIDEGRTDRAEWDGPWSEGEFRSDIEFTRKRLTEGGVDWDRTELVKGFFSDTLTPELRERLGLEKASLIMVDADLYTSSRDALAFCEPLIRDVSVIFFEDSSTTLWS